MRLFARIDNGVVIEVFPPLPTPPELLEILPEDGDIRPMFGFPFGVWQEITEVEPRPKQGWIFADGVFAEPLPYVPSLEEILVSNTDIRDVSLDIATRAIAPLQDAVDLEEATPTETALLKKWKQYRIAVNRIDLTVPDPAWPSMPV